MPDNTFLTPDVIAARALATLYNSTVMLPLVHRDFDSAFAGKVGDTVTARVPLTFTANEYDRNVGIVIQNAQEDRFPVVLDKLIDVSFEVTAEELLLDIEDFATQLLNPAMEAISQKVDLDLATEVVNAANQTADPGATTDYPARQNGAGVVTSPDADEPLKVLVPARTKLGRNKLPTMNRYAVLSPEGAGAILSGDLPVQANTRGDTDGLVEASIGRKFGFDTFETQQLGYGAGDLGQADGVGFHRDAVTFVTRVLPQPLSKTAQQASTVTYKGLGIRVVYDYDRDAKSDVVSVDCLYGTRAVRPQGAVELDLHQGS